MWNKFKIKGILNSKFLILNSQAGQMLLIVILAMVVALTVGLAVVSRSIVNINTSREEENSQRAFSAAEAGIERALRAEGGTTSLVAQPLDNNSTTQSVTITAVNGSELTLSGGNLIEKDDGTDIWLLEHNSDGTLDYSSPWNGVLTLYWGLSADACTTAAIEVIIISGSQASPSTARYAFDPCNSRNNNFAGTVTPGNFNIGGKNFKFKSGDISVTSGLVARVIPIYYGTMLGLTGKDAGGADNALPTQGKQIASVGTSGSTSRKIILYQGYRKLPSEFFQHLIFSP